MSMTRPRWIAAGFTFAAAALLAYSATAGASAGSLRRFDPDRMADLELRMWQAYYARERVRLFGLLVAMMRQQNHYSWTTAAHEGFYLARAAATFGDARSNYEQVLPDLERAYGIAKESLNAGFDAAAVARAELAWWVARRTPGENGPEQVGRVMADAYALLYETSSARVARAATLRAHAAALRDARAADPDWDEIGRLLRQSYRDLRLALEH
jgi:hypothetical protein